MFNNEMTALYLRMSRETSVKGMDFDVFYHHFDVNVFDLSKSLFFDDGYGGFSI